MSDTKVDTECRKKLCWEVWLNVRENHYLVLFMILIVIVPTRKNFPGKLFQGFVCLGKIFWKTYFGISSIKGNCTWEIGFRRNVFGKTDGNGLKFFIKYIHIITS